MNGPDLTGVGVPESTWRARGLPDRLRPLDLAALTRNRGRLVVLSPHPDDEILGCGGALRQVSAAGMDVLIVAVTDGEASHPGRAESLRSERAAERCAALALLGITAKVRRLGLADGRVQASDVADLVAPLLDGADLLFSPWEHDGHPDHDAVGTAAALLPCPRWSYLVWTWHWASVGAVPWRRAVRVPLDDVGWAAKRRAVGAFRSQLDGPAPILPANVLERLLRHDEVFLCPSNPPSPPASGIEYTETEPATAARSGAHR